MDVEAFSWTIEEWQVKPKIDKDITISVSGEQRIQQTVCSFSEIYMKISIITSDYATNYFHVTHLVHDVLIASINAWPSCVKWM